ncbi:hypothetical protein OSTOST_22856, partial [Ostertagia ostertagi]
MSRKSTCQQLRLTGENSPNQLSLSNVSMILSYPSVVLKQRRRSPKRSLTKPVSSTLMSISLPEQITTTERIVTGSVAFEEGVSQPDFSFLKTRKE